MIKKLFKKSKNMPSSCIVIAIEVFSYHVISFQDKVHAYTHTNVFFIIICMVCIYMILTGTGKVLKENFTFNSKTLNIFEPSTSVGRNISRYLAANVPVRPKFRLQCSKYGSDAVYRQTYSKYKAGYRQKHFAHTRLAR